MQYLNETVPLYSVDKDGYEPDGYEHHEVWEDEDSGETYVNLYGDETRRVYRVDERPAEWFSVAVYTCYDVYGGPEEGGWYYYAGGLVEHHRIKFFDNYVEAMDYSASLWDWCDEENKDRGDVRLTVRCTTETMPDTHYPKRRPYYC
jgi:hypothetical protein